MRFKIFLENYTFINYEDVIHKDDTPKNSKKLNKIREKKEPIKYDGTNLIYFLLQNNIRNQ